MCELQKHACFYNLDIVPTNLEYCLDKGGSGTLVGTGDESNNHQLKEGGVTSKCGSEVCPPFGECQTVALNQSAGTVQVCQCPTTCPQGTTVGASEKCCNMHVGILTNCPMITHTHTPADVEDEGPVCAISEKDGYKQNYANICQLRQDACQRQVELKVLHHGHCGTSGQSDCLTNLCAN